MFKIIFFLLAFSFSPLANLVAQKETQVYTAKFHSTEVIYNASPNPSECWEAVAWGIEINTGKAKQLFSLDWKDIDSLKAKIGNAEVQIEVSFYDEPEKGSGIVGEVLKITLDGEVIYKEQ